jgi:tetratricopeptide (TPR) repeat protein
MTLAINCSRIEGMAANNNPGSFCFDALRVIFCGFCSFIILSCTAFANTHSDEEAKEAIFLALKNAPDEAAARVYEGEIWRQWFLSGDDKIDALMQAAMQQRRNYDFAGAIETLNTVIQLKPDYAEGWNQRATVHFHRDEYEASLVDIAQTLVLEPRHFGALAGRAVIRLYQSKSALARQNIIEAVKINPYLRERQFFPGLSVE